MSNNTDLNNTIKITEKQVLEKKEKKSETKLKTEINEKSKPTKTRKKRKVNFINNKDLYDETVLSQKQGMMTDKLARMLMVLCDKYRASQNGDFTRYTYFDEMKSVALENLVKNAWRKFNIELYTNAFAFYTQCVHNSYLQYLTYEKRHRNIRDSLLVANGQTPSFKYMEENLSKTNGNYSSDDIVDTGGDIDYDNLVY